MNQRIYYECYQQYFQWLSLDSQVMLDLHELHKVIKERPKHVIEYFLNLDERPMLILENECYYEQWTIGGKLDKIQRAHLSNMSEMFNRVQAEDKLEINQTYIAYLFVEGRLANNEIIKGPIFLMPIKFVKSQSGLYFKRDQKRKCLINYPLIHKIAVSKNISLPPLKSIYDEVTKEDFMTIKRFINAIGGYLPKFSLETTPFTSHSEETFPAYKEGKLKIQNQLVLGWFENSLVFEQCCDMTNRKTTQEIQSMMESSNLLSNVVTPYLTKEKKPYVSMAKGGVMNRKKANITMPAIKLSSDTTTQEAKRVSTDVHSNQSEVESIIDLSTTQFDFGKLNQPMDLELLTLSLLTTQQNILIVCQSDAYRDQVVQQLKEMQSLHLTLPLNHSKLTLRKAQIEKSVCQSTQEVVLQPQLLKEHHIPVGIDEYLKQLPKAEAKKLLASATETNVHRFVTHHKLAQDYPQIEEFKALLNQQPLEVLLTDLNHVLKLIQSIESRYQVMAAQPIMTCIKQNIPIENVIRQQLTSEKLELETMKQSFLVRVLDAKKVEKQQDLITQIEKQMHQMYQLFTEATTVLKQSQAFSEIKKDELLESVFLCQSIIPEILKQQTDLQVISCLKQTYEEYYLIPDEVIHFLDRSELTDEVTLNNLMSQLIGLYQKDGSQRTIKQALTEKQRHLLIENAHDIWHEINKESINLASFDALVQDVSLQKGLESLISEHYEMLFKLYPVCVMTDKTVDLIMPTIPNMFDVVLIEEDHVIKPNLFLQLMTCSQQVLLYKSASVLKPSPTPSPQIKVSPQRIR